VSLEPVGIGWWPGLKESAEVEWMKPVEIVWRVAMKGLT
jgi:hypothetical protein